MGQRKPAPPSTDEVSGYAAGTRRSTGHPDGWHHDRADDQPWRPLPPRGSVRGNWEALPRSEATR